MKKDNTHFRFSVEAIHPLAIRRRAAYMYCVCIFYIYILTVLQFICDRVESTHIFQSRRKYSGEKRATFCGETSVYSIEH